MITTLVLAHTSITSHIYNFFFCGEKFKMYSLTNFQVYNTVLLAIITMVCVRVPELLHLTVSVYPLASISPLWNTFPVVASPKKLAGSLGTLLACVLRSNYVEQALDRELEMQVLKYWSKLGPHEGHTWRSQALPSQRYSRESWEMIGSSVSEGYSQLMKVLTPPCIIRESNLGQKFFFA